MAHRSSASVSTTSLAPPGSGPPLSQRRMSLPPPPAPLDLPEPVSNHRRPPSPLRNGFAIDPRTGELTNSSEDSQSREHWGQRPISPSPSVGQLATNLAQHVGSFINSMGAARSPGLPTDQELEAEAERERERSRREAERILAREAEERMTVEQRVMAMLANAPDDLRPPPSRSQTMPGTPPSPSQSQKDASWWSLAKQKLTPTKDSLTPAQQIIQDTKQRDKEVEKEKKKAEKADKRQRSKEWPSTPERRLDDPAFIKLGLAASPGRAMPASPTPNPRGMSNPPSLAASPMRFPESDTEGGVSPSRAPPPLYAQFNPQGALDVPSTLLTIAKRFEKLEKWTVSHVRALEERMDDVERWLVEKERDKEDGHGANGDAGGALGEIREEMAELQGRIGELGREMAKMVISPGNLSSGPGRNTTLARAPSTSSSIAVQSISKVVSPPRATPPRTTDATSPVTTPIPSNRNNGSRTRLPYPTGDYASPPDSNFLNGPFSPTNSPPASLSQASKGRQLSISGLPSHENDAFSVGLSTSPTPSGLPSSASESSGLSRSKPPSAATSPSGLPAPHPPAWRPSSASPTPRKRYTVALGTQIMPRESSRDAAQPAPRPSTPASHHSREVSAVGTAYFSTSPVSAHSALQSDYEPEPDADDDESEDDVGEETIGRSVGRQVSSHSHRMSVSGALALPAPSASSPPASPPQPTRRQRPQSMYAPMASQALVAPTSTITPLNVRLRSRSTDRLGEQAGAAPPATPSSGKFVDPLLVRRQQTRQGTVVAPKAVPGKKVPVGQLVAFFDQDK
ncbi:uncharacterized protein BXZ73DRAFT_48535 [Epithele typhae]|uniref:uncharacterized protein n=1 Tax=Epithele typhae TaxID=378194 RepID=UPI002008BBC4|nr:uncharacterized protein BXZ73DRAFT_48535 [Epithele typhae]KAH9928013.1 hypothetical protein BXZ73DRAFT_48535 [Epithele typhae]